MERRVKCAENAAFAFCENCVRSASLLASRRIAAAIAAGSFTGTVNPARASRTTSAIPPTSVTIAGSPTEKACKSDMGNPSDVDDMMKASAAEKNGATSSCCPQNVTCEVMPNCAARLSSALRSLPSPTIQSRKPGMDSKRQAKGIQQQRMVLYGLKPANVNQRKSVLRRPLFFRHA